jgi:hypothetical protein
MGIVSAIDSTHCINKVISCSGSNDVAHTGEEVPNSLDGQIKINVNPAPQRPSVKMHFRSGVSSHI